MFGEDTHSRSVVVSSAATARDVCHILVESTHCTDEENWALLEQHPSLGLGKNTRSSYDTHVLHGAMLNGVAYSHECVCRLKNAASRTMKWCLGCSPPGHKMATPSCYSVKTTPSTSSSKSQRYDPALL